MCLPGFHRWETPLYNVYLDGRSVTKKCQCGAVKLQKRYVPLPDTVEYVQYEKEQKRQIAILEDKEVEEDDTEELTDESPLGYIAQTAGILISLLVAVTIGMPIINSFMGGINGTTDNSFVFPVWSWFVAGFVALTIIVVGFSSSRND